MRRVILTLGAAALSSCATEAALLYPSYTSTRSLDQQQLASRYTYSVLPTLSGISRGNAINEDSAVAGYSNLPGGATRHAVLWQDGTVTDLGTLGGPNSNVPWPALVNDGTIAGIAETAAMDPLAEDWSCATFFPSATHHVCRGFVRVQGVMHELLPLGGTHSFATGVNGRGDVVGWSETAVHDPTCVKPQVLQFRATLWDAGSRKPVELRPLPGDSTSAATGINARGQVIGISGDCGVAVGSFSARHAVLWDHGTVTDLGNLGGKAWNTPMAINAAGDIVGFSDLPGDDDGVSREHAFLWTRKAGLRDLGTLEGDVTSQASGINAQGQVVGISCTAVSCRGFLWQRGVMTPLDSLMPLAKGDAISSAQDINNAGQITGRILYGGRRLAYLATPVTP